MKNFSLYLFIFLVLSSLSEPKKVKATLNPLMGYISFCINDMPEPEGIIDGCPCNGTKVQKSGDGLFSKSCICGVNCKCPKDQGSLPYPPKPDKAPEPKIVDDHEMIETKTFYHPEQYKRFKPKSRKEMWVLTTKDNWCLYCNQQKAEFEKMDKTGWKIDKKGDLLDSGDFHIRLIYIENFEGLPAYFFKGDGKTKEDLLLPTLVFWSDGKVKTTYHGFLNSYGLLKLFNEQPLEKGKDDVVTK